MSSNNNQQTAAFAEIASRYCAWCEGPAGEELEDMRTAAALLAGLHMVAFLTETESDYEGVLSVAKEDYDIIRERFECLPVRGFHSVADPSNGSDETVFADLANELTFIYGELKDGLALYNSGLIEEAADQWKLDYRIQWGGNLLKAEACVYFWLQRYDERAIREAVRKG